MKNYGLAIVIVLFFVLDVVNFIVDEKTGLSYQNSVSVYGRGLFELVVFYFLIKNYPLYKNSLLLIVFFLILPLIWLALFVFQKEIDLSFVLIIIKESHKFIFPILLFLFLREGYLKLKHFEVVYKFVFLISSTIVVLAFLFDISFFYTYNASRFGFKPPLATQNEISFFWIIGIVFLGARLFQKVDVSTFLVFVLVLFSASILGTKAILLFQFNTIVFFLVFFVKASLLKKVVAGLVLIISLFFVLYFSNFWGFFANLTRDEGFLFALTSKRNLLVIERLIPLIDSWSWYNFLIGGAYNGFPITEMDILDLFLVSGLVGCLIYFYLLFSTLFKFSKGHKLGYFFASQYILVGALAGHFYSSGINAILFAGLCVYLQQARISNKLKSLNL
ncbi:hypothetical protein [Marinilabilia salmonicolor]|uniref:O-antigen ligase-like membrane protein n=1 Tax=Marinilabilia salmonicolor TaxID=989 RepID=A0A368UPD5_9BACT|nr:hypothetical protein [Marinilabilia salmonicolor]RCW30035.1 hypothetical protein DFO77_12447 [Marinilabilia salmonicolor]